MTLNETRKRIKIADLIGWTCMETHNGQLRGCPPNFDPDSKCSEIDYEVPNYFHDLNAMHDVEKMLGECTEPYLDQLAQLPAPLYDVRATAAQRAEAFGRVKGLWE